jgi:hypothetical protein
MFRPFYRRLSRDATGIFQKYFETLRIEFPFGIFESIEMSLSSQEKSPKSRTARRESGRGNGKEQRPLVLILINFPPLDKLNPEKPFMMIS